MRTFPLLISGLIAHSAAALLTEVEYPFHPPGRGDLRSPCPALNAAANHGLLPRSGRDIDLATAGRAVLLGYNMTYETMLVIGLPALKTSTTGNTSTFHLSDLNQHFPQAVEHDASLTRKDAYFGGNGHFNKATWKRTLKSWGNIEIVDIAAAAKELKDRYAYGEKYNPTFNGTFARTPALLQYGLMLSTFGNTVTGDGNLTLIRYWIEKERLPLELGWQPSAIELTLPRNQLLAGNISALWDVLETE
ncbi:Chloroperoxidase [Boeremia exigua]|uniref:Chloroperoxidase n=1 Tax=Boeremia exigua TaxID=749465 RepID=UPI001E8D8B7A|nr:Chloroperoxidase [Boeremia exigua]KAH6616646.1 Chloroperoxidase [Boeremia exigua]